MSEPQRVVHHGPYPEFTWPAVLVGYGLGVLIAISIGYAALILGFSIEGSELAAILGWGILRGLMKRTSIIENNINQTIASAVNGASSGIMFSVSALFVLKLQYPGAADFNPVLLTMACITGAVVGLCFVIPLRKQMIDFHRLAYPGGIATAAILKSPGAGKHKAVVMLTGALISGVATLLLITVGGGSEFANVGAALGIPAYFNVVFFLSLMTVGVGFLSGKGGLWFGAGGFLCYFLLSPLLAAFGGDEIQDVVDQGPGAMRGTLFLPAGIGMLIGAAVGSIFFAAPMIKSAIRSMHQAPRLGKGGAGETSQEMPIKLLYIAIAAGGLILVTLSLFSTPEMTLTRAVAMAVLGMLWVWVAGVIVSECVGRTNWSPLSGMTLIAVTILCVIASQSGMAAVPTYVAAMFIGAGICVAISQASDMMLDLKAGYLVGASPKKQQYAQFAGVWLGPIVVMALIFVLDAQYGIGSDKLPAPQATALATTMASVVEGDVPVDRYGASAALGLMFALSGFGGIGVLVGLGFYMPFGIVLTYTIGNFLRMAADRVSGRHFVENTGIPLAAGLIVGEALVGVGRAVYTLTFGEPPAGGH